MGKADYEIVEKIAVFSKSGEWTKELNLISWAGKPKKYDLRRWNHKEERMGKGISLNGKELKNLLLVLNTIVIEEDV